MDVLTIALIFAEYLPRDYIVCHVKDHKTNETSFIIQKGNKTVAEIVKGYSDSPHIRFLAEIANKEDVVAINQALEKHDKVYSNRNGNFSYVSKGADYENSKRYSIVQLRPVS